MPPFDQRLTFETYSPLRKHRRDFTVDFNSFVRKPFKVEAVEITTDNINEVAKLVGTLREKDDGSPYIQVDRRLVPNVYKVYPGFWMTRMGNNIRCYSSHIFQAQFVGVTEEIEGFLSHLGVDGATPEDTFPQEGKIQGAEENVS